MKLSCGVVPFRKHGKRIEFLLLRCYRNWDFPKGMIDEGEAPLKAAEREFKEETGISDLRVLSPDDFIDTEKYNDGKVARFYVGEVAESAEVQLVPNPTTGILEHQEYRWMSREEAHAHLVPRLQRVLKWAEERLAIENVQRDS